MSTSKLRNVPPPETGAARAPVYARFIPREELSSFSAWRPGALGDGPADAANATPAPPAAPTPAEAAEQLREQMHAARQGGYQDGYRDGLAALEGFKRTYAAQVTAQVGTLASAVQAQLDALQQRMAQALATTATQLARQVVRSELATRPALVATVAEEALDTLLPSARHITLRVHPDDHALVAQGAAEALAAASARLVPDAAVSRGGCVVESDLGAVDASVEARWRRAAATLGCNAPWEASPTGEDE